MHPRRISNLHFSKQRVYTLLQENVMDTLLPAWQDLLGSPDAGRRLAHLLERANRAAVQTGLEPLIEQALGLMIEACHAQAGLLYLPEQETGALVCRAAQGVGGLQGRNLGRDASLVGRAFGEGKPVLIEQVAAGSNWETAQDGWHGFAPACLYAYPLSFGDRPVGVVELLDFSLAELPWVQVVGSRLVTEIDRAVQLEAARLHNERLEVMLSIFGQIGSTLDRDQILRLMIEFARDVIRAEACSLFLVDQSTGEAVLYLASNVDQQFQRGDIRVPAGKGIIGHVVESGEIVRVSDVKKDDRHFRGSDHTTGFITRAILAVPLRSRQVILGGERGKIDERIIGGFEAINKMGGNFTEDDAQLLLKLANQAATVLEIADLYSDANELFFDVVKALTEAIDAKDPYTEGHSQRVCEFSVAIARQMNLPTELVHRIRIGSLLHDVGKIGVPDSILSKPGHLSEQEFALIKLHPAIGAKIMSQVRLLHAELPAMAEHHERLDGNGYPKGLKGDGISQAGRIVAVADVFDALTSNRPYRAALAAEEAFDYLSRGIDTAFDRSCVEALIQAYLRGTIHTQKEREQLGRVSTPQL
jgi:HD-GYP domain-containing protein (c-di-GMP phosphodiesterase class II)